MSKDVKGYSAIQIALHWTVLVLVAFQFLAHDGMEDAWRGFLRSQGVEPDTLFMAYLHIAIGLVVLALMLLRLALRIFRGVPSPPSDEPVVLQWTAELVHWLIYALLIALPVSGAVAWFLGVEIAAEAHEIMKDILLYAIVLHVGGALFQHFIRRSDVLMRMLRPDRAR